LSLVKDLLLGRTVKFRRVMNVFVWYDRLSANRREIRIFPAFSLSTASNTLYYVQNVELKRLTSDSRQIGIAEGNAVPVAMQNRPSEER